VTIADLTGVAVEDAAVASLAVDRLTELSRAVQR